MLDACWVMHSGHSERSGEGGSVADVLLGDNAAIWHDSGTCSVHEIDDLAGVDGDLLVGGRVRI